MSNQPIELTIEEIQNLIADAPNNDKETKEDVLDEIDAEGVNASNKWGVYCNCLTIDSGSGGYVHYRRGKRGTSNYGCKSDKYKANKSLARYIKQVGSCPSTACGKKTMYLVTNYRT